MTSTLRIVSFSILLSFLSPFYCNSQSTVFSETFAASSGGAYTTANGPVGSSTIWSQTRGTADFGAAINSGRMVLTNDASGAANNSSWILASTAVSGFAAPYNAVLASNPGLVTWSFNLRQMRSNPGGLATGLYGVAYILAGTTGSSSVTGTGYAVTLGNSGKTDPVRLVRYNAGVRSNTILLSSTTSGLTDFGNEHISIRVTYNPVNNVWQLFVRNDGAAFQDPSTGILTSQGTVTNSNYTSSSLGIMGTYWNGATAVAQTSFVDNIKVGVTVPLITSLSPPSKVAGTGAFSITVNGTDFLTTSVGRWNGSVRPTTYVSPTQLTMAIAASDIANAGTVAISVANSTAVSNDQTFTIDSAGVPSLTVSTNVLPAFSTVSGTASSSQNYSLNGANLTADATITAPANFELSLSAAGGFTNTLTIPRNLTTLSIPSTPIYVRVKSTAPAGILNGDIVNTTPGANSKLVGVTARALAIEPVTQASAVAFSNVTSTSFTINFTAGSGTNRLVVLRAGSAVNAIPVDGQSYVASTFFSFGSEITTSNYVVYSGTGNSVNITGLTAATTYHVAVFEFNGNGTTENYRATTPATGNRLTLNAPLGWQIYTANSVNTIDFDNSVDGVNNQAFQGDGFSTTPTVGMLNSKAWAVAGFAVNNLSFDGTSAEDSELDRGTAVSDVGDAGIYAFETTANNKALGIQPTSGNFAPGSITLKFQNQTGAPISTINIGYRGMVYNDQPGSSSLTFSHGSTATGTFTNIPIVNLVSPADADATPEWKSHYKALTLTGLNIPANGFYYIRWSGVTVSGTGEFDEFAIDDIKIVAAPSTNFVTFDGNAETFVLQGNAKLTGNTTVADITFNGGKLDIAGQTLTLTGPIQNVTAQGLKGSSSSNLNVTGNVNTTLSFDQTSAGITNVLNNLTIGTSAANFTTIATPIVVNGLLSVAHSQSLDMGSNALAGTLNTILNNGTITTQNTSATPFPASKTWGGVGTIIFNAATPQTVVSGIYNDLRISNPSGATASGSFTVNGVLDLPVANPSAFTGSLAMGSFTLTMGGLATNTGIGDVTGIITRSSITSNALYTFGHADTSIIFQQIGTLPSSMSLKVTIGNAPSWRPAAIKRHYDFVQTGASGTKAVIKAHYLDSELNGVPEGLLVDWAYIVANGQSLEQGRSNFSTTENWVELTNVNVAVYFVSTFDAVYLTLDKSVVQSSVWTGAVSDSWTTVNNWAPPAVPSGTASVRIPDASTTPFDPTVNPLVILGTLNIESGAIVNAPTGSQLTVNGGAGAWMNNGVFNAGSGTSRVIFTSPDATVAGSTTFNNVTINANAGLRPLTNNYMSIAGSFINNGILYSGAIENTIEYVGTNQTLAIPNAPTVSAYSNLKITGTGAIFPPSLNIRGNLTIDQPVELLNTTLNFVGLDNQYIAGAVTPAFGNIVVNKPQGELILSTGITVNNTLTLNNGLLVIGGNNLTLGANPVVGTFGVGNMIVADGVGQVRRSFNNIGSYFFPIGEKISEPAYSPISIAITSGSFSNGLVSVSVHDAVHPNNSSVVNYLTRYWNISQTGITSAIANIAATYVPADAIGGEENISAAQLAGTFNQQTNPWIKFGALSNSTLSATGVILAPNQTSAFTGIKGAAFSVVLTGYGQFCQDAPAPLLADPLGGDAPYTYTWSAGLGTAATATAPTTTVGTVPYTVTVKDSNGITATDTATVVTLPPSVGGTLQNQSICAGTQPADIVLMGNIGDVLFWQSSVNADFSSPVNISNTTNTLSGLSIGNLTVSTYYRAVVRSGNCSTAFSGIAAVIISSTTWNGTTWSNGLPTASTSVVITGNMTASGNINACTMTISNNAVVNIPAGFNVVLDGALTVTSGSFTLESNANLIQNRSNITNSGNIIVKRKSSPLFRLDYTLWSSPVIGMQTLAEFSPLTSTTRFYNYDTSTNTYVTVSPSIVFAPAKSYLIRMPNNWVAYNAANPQPATWTGNFVGVASNGNISYNLVNTGIDNRFNAVGNPYPSAMNIDAFISQNAANIEGTLWFWRKTNDGDNAISYSTCTTVGCSLPNGNTYSNDNYISVGQGFLVKATGSAVNFNNSMRAAVNVDQFFRNSNNPVAVDRYWLSLKNAAGSSFGQKLVAYVPEATIAYDNGLDGLYIGDSPTALLSYAGNSEVVIQARPQFASTDIVPLVFKTNLAGSYNISIADLEGVFDNEQTIFIRDKSLNIVHDIKLAPYNFTTEAGNFADRFEMLYESMLNVVNPDETSSDVIAYKAGSAIEVRTAKAALSSVQVYDIRGRLVAEQTNLNTASTTINAGAANQVLIIKITLENGSVVTRKLIN